MGSKRQRYEIALESKKAAYLIGLGRFTLYLYSLNHYLFLTVIHFIVRISF